MRHRWGNTRLAGLHRGVPGMALHPEVEARGAEVIPLIVLLQEHSARRGKVKGMLGEVQGRGKWFDPGKTCSEPDFSCQDLYV